MKCPLLYISQIFRFFFNFKYCRLEQLRLVTLSNGCLKEVRNPKLSGIPHRSGILSKAIARARSRSCNLASKFLSRRREIDRALFPLNVISLDLSAKLLANSQHQITTGQIPSKLNGQIEYLSQHTRFRNFETLDCKRRIPLMFTLWIIVQILCSMSKTSCW